MVNTTIIRWKKNLWKSDTGYLLTMDEVFTTLRQAYFDEYSDYSVLLQAIMMDSSLNFLWPVDRSDCMGVFRIAAEKFTDLAVTEDIRREMLETDDPDQIRIVFSKIEEDMHVLLTETAMGRITGRFCFKTAYIYIVTVMRFGSKKRRVSIRDHTWQDFMSVLAQATEEVQKEAESALAALRSLEKKECRTPSPSTSGGCMKTQRNQHLQTPSSSPLSISGSHEEDRQDNRKKGKGQGGKKRRKPSKC